MKILGITGNICAGKTYISNLITKEFDIPYFNCDNEARTIMNDDDIKIKMKALFDRNPYIIVDGVETLDRKYVASIIFVDSNKLDIVDNLVHDEIIKKLELFIKHHENSPFILVETANMVKTNFYKIMDYVIYVDAPFNIRKERSKLRDFTEADFENRNRNQKYIIPESFIIYNNVETVNIETLFNKISKLFFL
jgi:dephospho-CoA kinase